MTDQLENLIVERLDLLAEQDKVKARLDDNAAALLPLLTAAGGRAELPGLPGQGFTVAAPRQTFSSNKLEEVLGTAGFQAICKFPPSNKGEAASVVAGSIVDACMVSSGKPSLRKLGGSRG
jgi:hypothetical protein